MDFSPEYWFVCFIGHLLFLLAMAEERWSDKALVRWMLLFPLCWATVPLGLLGIVGWVGFKFLKAAKLEELLPDGIRHRLPGADRGAGHLSLPDEEEKKK